MFARLSRVRRPWLVAVVVVAIALVVVEGGRLVAAQSSITRAASEAARYAVTGLYNPQKCIDYGLACTSADQDTREAAQDAARLATINDVARTALDAEATATAQVAVCSGRLDAAGHALYTYDSATGRCLPHDDAGGPGDKVVVAVATDYPIGAFLGPGIGSIRLQAVQNLIVERFRTVRIQGLPPTIAASGADATTRSESGAANGQISPTAVPAPVTSQTGREQMIVMNGDLQLRVTETDQGLTRVKAIAVDVGGYVAKSEVGSDGATRSARAELRIPATQFQSVMERLKGLAVEVIRESAVGEDVTEEYVDLEGRLKGVQATAARTELDFIHLKETREQGKLRQISAKRNADADPAHGLS